MMKHRTNPHVEFVNAKRAALKCLENPDSFSTSYLQIALERMWRALLQMAPLQLPSGEPVVDYVEEPALRRLLHSHAVNVSEQ